MSRAHLSAAPPRPATGMLPPGWADKTDRVLVWKPVHLRRRFRQRMLTLLLAAIAAGALGAFLLQH